MKNVTLFFLFSLFSFVLFSQERRDSLAVYFDNDSYQISTKLEQEIIQFVNTSMKGEEKLEGISIAGYCDKTGSSIYNQTLSNRRVEAVRKVLLETNKGVENHRIKTEANGSQLTPTNGSDKNWRRVDLVIVSEEMEEVVNTALEDLSKAKSGVKLVLDNLNFEGGRSQLLPGSEKVLEELYQKLIENPSIKIEIQGHVCCTKPEKDGFDKDTKTFNLSTNRAKAIYDILIEKGVASDRLSYKGMKGDFPLVPELTIEDMVKNRRVEIKIVD